MSYLHLVLRHIIPSLCHLDMITCLVRFFLPFDKQGIKGMFAVFLYSFIKNTFQAFIESKRTTSFRYWRGITYSNLQNTILGTKSKVSWF